MGKITVDVCYPEPEVWISGKYSREISIDEIKRLIAHLKSIHGRKLETIKLVYDKRKDGPIATFYLWTHDPRHFKKRFHDETVIVFYHEIRKHVKGKGTITVEEAKEVFIPISEIEELMSKGDDS